MTPAIKTPELLKTKQEAKKQSAPLIEQAHQLQITDEDSYQIADSIRASLKAASKKWTDRLQLIIRPAYDTLQGLYNLRKEIVDPMDASADVVTNKMKEFKRLEAVRTRQEADAKTAKEAELRKKLEAATSIPVQRMMEKRIEEVQNVIITAPVVAASSSTRTVKKWKVDNMQKLVRAVADSQVPIDILTLNSKVFEDYFRGDDKDKTAISSWPGILVYDDIQIVSKK